LPLRGRIWAIVLTLVGTLSFFVWLFFLHQNFTTLVPEVGGEYTEGVVSEPRYINPLLAQTSQADADLVNVIYDGLFTRSGNGEVIPHLASGYEISNDGKQYTVHLREGVLWHDGESFDAEDVVYTVRTLQDPTFKSPLRSAWLGVDVEAKDSKTLVFTLKKEYFGFLENLTLGVLPKHIWQSVPSEKFLLTEYNLAPIGTGPYRFKDSEKDGSGNILSVKLSANKGYFLGQPYIEDLNFYFYENAEALLSAYNQKQVDGMYNIRPEDRANIASQKGTVVNTIDFPRTFSIFWNITKSVPLADAKVREALSYAVDKDQITQKVMMNDAIPAYGPLLPFMVHR
jgi:peptide/nickel transport system substrate-binding protein